MNGILTGKEYLVGDQLTHIDIRLFMTLIRFDVAYSSIFKCNQRTISTYPNLTRYVKSMLHGEYDLGANLNIDHIKRHYFKSYPRLNPSGILPFGPDEWWATSQQPIRD